MSEAHVFSGGGENTGGANVSGLLLLLDVLAQQGRDVMVIPRSKWRQADLHDVDYVVVEDDTWRAWHNAIGYP